MSGASAGNFGSSNPPNGAGQAMAWGQPQPFQAFMQAAAQQQAAAGNVSFPPGLHLGPPPPGAFPHHLPPHLHPAMNFPSRGGPFAPFASNMPPPHGPLSHPLPPPPPHLHGPWASVPAAATQTPPPGAAVYDVKTIERHIHQLLRGGPIQDEHAQAEAESADLQEVQRGSANEFSSVTATRPSDQTGEEVYESDEDDEDNEKPNELSEADGDHHSVSNGEQKSEKEPTTSRGNDKFVQSRSGRGRGSRRDYRDGANGNGFTRRPRSDSRNGAGGRSSENNDNKDRTKQGRQFSKQSKPGPKSKRQAGEGTTAQATHRRLPPPETQGDATTTATSTTESNTTPSEATDGSNGHHVTSKPHHNKQWVAKGQKTVAANDSEHPSTSESSQPKVQPAPPKERKKLVKVSLDREKLIKMSKDILATFDNLRPSNEEMQAKYDLIKRLQALLGDLWPDFPAKLNLFGSSANGFCLKNSDLDICMTIDKRAGSKTKIVNRIARVLRDNKMKGVTALSHASVPIVKFEDPVSNFSCDICINNILALHNTHMIRQYSRVDSRLLQMGYFIKHWAKSRKLDEPYTGTLSSYAWILLVINFLQQRDPPILPCLQRIAPNGDRNGDIPVVKVKGHDCYYYSEDISRLRFRSTNQETLAELVLDFFYLYAEEFDYDNQVVSVRRGTMLTKREKRWDKMPKTVKENHWFSIEDPFDLTHDLGRVVDQDSLKAIQHEIRRAYSILSSTGSLAEGELMCGGDMLSFPEQVLQARNSQVKELGAMMSCVERIRPDAWPLFVVIVVIRVSIKGTQRPPNLLRSNLCLQTSRMAEPPRKTLSLRDLREKFEAMKEEEARKTPTTPSGTKVKELQRLQSDPNFRSTFREMAALWKEKEEENPPVNRPRAGSLSTTLPQRALRNTVSPAVSTSGGSEGTGTMPLRKSSVDSSSRGRPAAPIFMARTPQEWQLEKEAIERRVVLRSRLYGNRKAQNASGVDEETKKVQEAKEQLEREKSELAEAQKKLENERRLLEEEWRMVNEEKLRVRQKRKQVREELREGRAWLDQEKRKVMAQYREMEEILVRLYRAWDR